MVSHLILLMILSRSDIEHTYAFQENGEEIEIVAEEYFI
jgi:hypothetical protein